MTQEQHPITPPDELVMEWINKHYGGRVHRDLGGVERTIATQSARWGADQELEACCEHVSQWFATPKYRVAELRAARRPKPPSLKEQALRILAENGKTLDGRIELEPEDIPTILSAIQSIPD